MAKKQKNEAPELEPQETMVAEQPKEKPIEKPRGVKHKKAPDILTKKKVLKEN